MFELQYLVVGLIQGITEFLPISSSGHLVLISKISNWDDQGLFTDIAVHGGTLIAVLVYLRREIIKILHNLHKNGNTIILVTHEESIADLALRKIKLFDGKIIEDIKMK